MMLCNHTSRYHVAAAAIKGGALHNQKVASVAHEKESYVMHLATKEREYIYANGKGEERHLDDGLGLIADGLGF